MKLYNHVNFDPTQSIKSFADTLHSLVQEYKLLIISGAVGEPKHFYEPLLNALAEKKCYRTKEWEDIKYRPGARAYNRMRDFHTDEAAEQDPGDLALMYCELPAESDGIMLFIDGAHLHVWLMEEDPVLVQALLAESVIFSGGSGERKEPIIQIKGSEIAVNWNKKKVSEKNTEEALYLAEAFSKKIEEYATISGAVLETALERGEGILWRDSLVLHARTPVQSENPTARFLRKASIIISPAGEGEAKTI